MGFRRGLGSGRVWGSRKGLEVSEVLGVSVGGWDEEGEGI